MIPRAEIEFTLKVAEAGARCEAPAKVMEELCRVYLRWLDAPEGRVTCAFEPDVEAFGMEGCGTLKEGQRVRLVEAPDERG